jgi:flagellar basal body-associated protein FliL
VPEEKVEAPEGELPEKNPSSLSKILLIVVIALVSSIGGGVVSWLLISRTIVRTEAKAGESDKKIDEVAQAIEKGGAIALEPFVVNLADTSSPRYLRIKVSLMIDDAAKLKELTETSALQLKLRDVILQTLTGKISTDLITEEGKKQLRTEIQSKVAGYFKKPKLVDVMFTEFVIQL